MPDSGRRWGQEGHRWPVRGQAEDPLLHCPAFQTQTTCLLTRGGGAWSKSPLLAQPSGKRSQLLPPRVPLPQILGRAQAGDQGRARSSFTLLGGDTPFLAPKGSRLLSSATPGPGRLPLAPPALYGTHRPGLEPGSHGKDYSSEALGSQPLAQYHFRALFLRETRAFRGHLWKTQLSLVSFFQPWAERRVRGPKPCGPPFLSSFWFPRFLSGADSGPSSETLRPPSRSMGPRDLGLGMGTGQS